MDRPTEIVRFETLALIACLLNLVSSLTYVPYVVSMIAAAIIDAALVLWISRGRSPVGRIVLTFLSGLSFAVVVIGAILLPRILTTGFDVIASSLGVSLLITALNIAALVFLWSAPSTAWLKKQADAALTRS